MTGKDRNEWPILMIDDEPLNISDLEDLIDSAAYQIDIGIRMREFCASAEQAIFYLIRSMTERRRYSAIITDNHLNSDYEDCLDGDEFLQVITGNIGYALSRNKDNLGMSLDGIGTFQELLGEAGGNEEDRVYVFLRDNFSGMPNYRDFVDYYFGDGVQRIPLIMLCGSPSEAALEGLEDRVITIQKQPLRLSGRQVYFCEAEIMRILAEEGVLPADSVQKALEMHPRFSSNTRAQEREYRPRQNWRG